MAWVTIPPQPRTLVNAVAGEYIEGAQVYSLLHVPGFRVVDVMPDVEGLWVSLYDEVNLKARCVRYVDLEAVFTQEWASSGRLRLGGVPGQTRFYLYDPTTTAFRYWNGTSFVDASPPPEDPNPPVSVFAIRNAGFGTWGVSYVAQSAFDAPQDFVNGYVYDVALPVSIVATDGYEIYLITSHGAYYLSIGTTEEAVLLDPVPVHPFLLPTDTKGYVYSRYNIARAGGFYLGVDGRGRFLVQRQSVATKYSMADILRRTVRAMGLRLPRYYFSAAFPYWCALVTEAVPLMEGGVPGPAVGPDDVLAEPDDVPQCVLLWGDVEAMRGVVAFRVVPNFVPVLFGGVIWMGFFDGLYYVKVLPQAYPRDAFRVYGQGTALPVRSLVHWGTLPQLVGSRIVRALLVGPDVDEQRMRLIFSRGPVHVLGVGWGRGIQPPDTRPREVRAQRVAYDTLEYIMGDYYMGEDVSLAVDGIVDWNVRALHLDVEPAGIRRLGESEARAL